MVLIIQGKRKMSHRTVSRESGIDAPVKFGVWLKTAELSVLICCNHKFSMHLTTWYLH